MGGSEDEKEDEYGSCERGVCALDLWSGEEREFINYIFFFVSFSAVGISAENFVSLSGKNLILGKREREREREGEREEK
jgi:hypothetical protein